MGGRWGEEGVRWELGGGGWQNIFFRGRNSNQAKEQGKQDQGMDATLPSAMLSRKGIARYGGVSCFL